MKKFVNLLLILLPFICVYFIGFDKYIASQWWVVALPFIVTWLVICFLVAKKSKKFKLPKSFYSVLRLVFFFIIGSMSLVLFVSHNAKIKLETDKFKKDVVKKLNQNSAYQVVLDGTQSSTKFVGDYASIIVDKSGITPLFMRNGEKEKNSFINSVHKAKIQDFIPENLQNKQIVIKLSSVKGSLDKE